MVATTQEINTIKLKIVERLCPDVVDESVLGSRPGVACLNFPSYVVDESVLVLGSRPWAEGQGGQKDREKEREGLDWTRIKKDKAACLLNQDFFHHHIKVG
jgi:hypothetical protein